MVREAKAGAGACVTPSVRIRQAYFGRTVTPPAHVNMRCRAADDTQLCRHDVQALDAILTDPMHDTTATRADHAVRFDDLFNAWRAAGKLPIVRLGTGVVAGKRRPDPTFLLDR